MTETKSIDTNHTSYISKTSGLKTKDYMGYALGDVGCCLVFGLITSVLQKFYTDILHLGPIFIMVMMLVARLWDAINDPIMGRIADLKKRTPRGRYKSWLLYGGLPLAVVTVLLFTKWPGLGETSDHLGTMIYATITYIVFGMIYTMVQIPYGSLSNVVTTDEGEKNKLSIWRSIGAGLGSIPAILIGSFCYKNLVIDGVEQVGENGKVIQVMQQIPVMIGVIIFALLMVMALFACYKMSTERVVSAPSPVAEKGKNMKVFKTLLKNRSFIAFSLAGMLLLAGQMFSQSFNLYLFADYFGKGWLNVVSVICLNAPMVLLIFVTPKLIKKFGKKELCAVGIATTAVAYLLQFACRSLMPDALWLLLVLSVLAGFGQAILTLQVWSMVSDTIDDVEVKTGMREDGTAYALFMFFRKFGQMIAAIAINGALLIMNYNYNPGAIQTHENLQVMYDLATIIPAVMFGIMALILIFMYPLNKKRVAELQVLKEERLREKFEKHQIILDSVDDQNDSIACDVTSEGSDSVDVAGAENNDELTVTDESEVDAVETEEIQENSDAELEDGAGEIADETKEN